MTAQRRPPIVVDELYATNIGGYTVAVRGRRVWLHLQDPDRDGDLTPSQACALADALEACASKAAKGETLDDKARRLIVQGRVRVVDLKPRRRVVTVQGDTGTHRVVWIRNQWHCSCPARGECSHARAAELASIAAMGETASWWDGAAWRARRSP